VGLVQACEELGAALVAFSPVGRALLTDTPHDAASVANIDFMKNNPRFMEPNFSLNMKKNAEFRALAADFGVPAAALAIAWLTHQGPHVLPIPGTRSAAHLKECVQGAKMVLSAGDLARIETVLPIGWCYGDRYNAGQWEGPEKYS